MNALSLKYYDVGYITNLVTSDLFAVLSFTRFTIEIFRIPAYIVTVTALVTWNFGWVGLVIPLIILINFFVQYGLTSLMAKSFKTKMKLSDKRSSLISETIKGIKNIKFNGWEGMVKDMSNKIRSAESWRVFYYFTIRIISDGIGNTIPAITVFTLICLRLYFYGDLGLGETLAIIAYGNMLVIPSKFLVITLNYYKTAMVAFGRLERLIQVPMKAIENLEVESEVKKGTL